MLRNKLTRKIAVAKGIFKEQGTLGVLIVGLQFAQKHASKRSNVETRNGIDTGAPYEHVLAADPKKPANLNWGGRKKAESLTINWLMPPPGRGSGGHMTLFRFIKYLEDAGHTCRLYFHKPGPNSSVAQVRNAMGDDFPKLKASMQWLWPGEELAPADALVATSWQTAYTIYASKTKAKKFYFVQDFEPYFYPVGGFYALAENTYRLGLRGITAGGWLAKKLHDDYGMTTDYFNFGSDGDTYQFTQNQSRKEIVFYARPTTERRAFELGILTLDLFHKKHPDYTINFIGWDVSEFNIPFPYKNLGILGPSELNELYNKCSASLVMSMTNMSLLPLELLSSGCIPVVTDGPNNRLVSDNAYIEYSPSNPVDLAGALSRVVTRKNLTEYAHKASKSVRSASWDESGAKVVKIFEKSVTAKGDK